MSSLFWIWQTKQPSLMVNQKTTAYISGGDLNKGKRFIQKSIDQWVICLLVRTPETLLNSFGEPMTLILEWASKHGSKRSRNFGAITSHVTMIVLSMAVLTRMANAILIKFWSDYALRLTLSIMLKETNLRRLSMLVDALLMMKLVSMKTLFLIELTPLTMFL